MGTIFLVFSGILFLSGTHTCTWEDFRSTQQLGFNFMDWREVLDSYSRFQQCDDGGETSESYSDSVVRLLAAQWEKFPQLVKISKRNKGFRNFVLRHIDATTSNDDLHKVVDLAENHCPRGAHSLCLLITTQAKSALVESQEAIQVR